MGCGVTAPSASSVALQNPARPGSLSKSPSRWLRADPVSIASKSLNAVVYSSMPRRMLLSKSASASRASLELAEQTSTLSTCSSSSSRRSGSTGSSISTDFDTHTLARHRPKLLVLDPYVRLQRVDENDATKVSAVLAALRELSRTFRLAIILVHHTRKNSSDKPGLALRGSSDFHAWGDSNLYLRPQRGDLILTSEHRFAAPAPPLGLTLVAEETPVRLEVILENAPDDISSFGERILVSLGARPRRQNELRRELRIRNQKLTDILRDLQSGGLIDKTNDGWQLVRQT